MPFGFNPNRPGSLRGQLIGLVAALAVPLIALQLWWGYRESQRAMEAAAAEAHSVANETGLRVGQFLAQAELIMTATSGEYGERWVSGTPCDLSMRNVATIFTFLVGATTVDGDGNVMCSSVGSVLQGISAADWRWFSSMVEDPQFYVGNPVLNDISGTWVLPLVAPILDPQGRFAGAIASSGPLLEFDRMVGADRQDQEVLTVITTVERIVVARSLNAEEWVGRQLAPWTGPGRTVGPGGETARAHYYDGIDRVWAKVEVDNGWWVYAGLPAEAVFGPARATAFRQISITLLILLMGMLVASRSYRRIGSALRELASSITMTWDGEAIPLPQGTPMEVRAIVEQFNETLQSRNRAEAAERASRERYQSIFDNAVFGLLVSTLDGRFLEVNASLVSMLGFESAQALIDAGPEALYPSPDTRPGLVEKGRKAHAIKGLGGQPIEDWEVDWVRADGEPITVRLNGKMIEMAGGEPACEVIVQDITDEKQRDNELRQTQKMEAIGRLAGGIAHDFNNLLTVIGGNADFIEDDLPPDHPLRAEVEQIMKATERATSLTSQLLAFSRKEPWGVRRVDLNEVITSMEKMLVRLIGEDVTLETRLAPDPPHVLIDPGELDQIIMNLVLNARDAMPTGGRVVIETRFAALDLENGDGSSTEDGILLSVRDAGLGMDPETRKRAFEPFYTTKAMGEGTGLGLSTVYGIVQRAEGHIHVESEPGQGTTIGIWFPHARADRVEDVEGPGEGPAEAPADPAAGNERILVVEDEELVRFFVQRVLEDVGYEILTACDGAEALEIVEGLDAPVDLVLTDVVMPRMKGPELAKRLSTISPETAVLYMSGYIDNREVSEQLADHADGVLQKPFSTTELREQVRLLLERRSAFDQSSAGEETASRASGSRGSPIAV